MSRSSRRELAWLFGAGLIVLTLVGWSALAALQKENGRAQQHERQAEAEERGTIEALLLDPREQAITNETRARRQSERERRDLDAQRTMANWAVVQGVVGILGLVGLGFTVFFAGGAWHAAKKSAQADFLALKNSRIQLQEARSSAAAQAASSALQLKTAQESAAATRATADATMLIGRRRSRAYVLAVGARYIPPPKMPQQYTGGSWSDGIVQIDIQNIGQTVAKDVKVRAWVSSEDVGSFEYADGPKMWTNYLSNIAPHQQPAKIAECRPADGVFVPAEDNLPRGYAVLRGEVRYTDVYGDRFRTCFVYWIYRGLKSTSEVRNFNVELGRMDAFELIDVDPHKDN